MSAQEVRLKAIADAIREKDGTTALIPANDFPIRIRAISAAPEGLRTISLSANDEAGGKVSGGGSVEEGMTVTVKAMAEDGYAFKGWQEEGETVNENAEYTFTVVGDRALAGVFESKRLPDGYTEVEYIESDGWEYIDTEFSPTNDSRVFIEFNLEYSYAYGNQIFGAASHSYLTVGAFSAEMGFSAFEIHYGTQEQSIPKTEFDRHTIDLNGNTLLLDGASYTFEADVFDTGCSIFLFNIHTANTISQKCAVGKLYSCKIYGGGVLSREYVPCIDPTGAVGLYDLVEGKFYANAGSSGAFAAGPAV